MAKKQAGVADTERRRRSSVRKRPSPQELPDEELHKIFFENANDACAIFTESGVILLVNPAIERLLGWSPAELQGQPLSMVATPASLLLAEERTRLWRAGQYVPTLFEIDLIRKDGSPAPVEAHTRVIKTTPGQPLVFQGIFRDITERKQAARQLQLSEERYRLVSESMSGYAFSFRIDENGTLYIEWLTASFEKITGYPAADLLEKPNPLQAYMHPDDLVSVLQTVQHLQPGTPTTYTFRIITKGGEVRWIESQAYAVTDTTSGRLVRLYGAATDITARKEAAAALAQQEAYFRALIEHSSDMIVVLGEDGAIRYSSPSAVRVLGYSPADEATRTGFDFVHPDDLTQVMEAFKHLLANPANPTDLELRVQHKNGSWRSLHATGTNLLHNPAVHGIVINSRDVTDRKQREEHFRTLVDSIVDVMYTLNPDGTVGSLNAPFETITGWKVQEWEGQSFADLVHPDDLPLAIDMFQRALNGEETPMFELRIQTKFGDYKIGEFRGKALEQAGKQFVLGVSRDITERRKAEHERDEAEQKLRQSEVYRAQVADTMPDILYVYDLNSHELVYINRQVGLLGYTPEELRLKHEALQELLHPDDIVALHDRYAPLVTEDTRELEDIEYRARHRNGEWRWFTDRATVFQRTAEGRPIQVLGVAQDITERKRLERLLQQREVEPKELAERLRKFRDSLGLTQEEFGKEFGKYKATQISTYETGIATIPTELFVSIWAKGFPLEVIFGASPTEIIEKTALYFTTNYAERQYTRKVLEAVVQMLKKDETVMARALRELDLSPRSLLTEQKNLLAALGVPPTEEE